MAIHTLSPARLVEPAALHAAFTAAFADYLLGPSTVALPAWPAFLASQDVDLEVSRVVQVDGAIVAFALAAPRRELSIWRLAAMGAVPASRGGGAAPRLVDDFVDRAVSHGMRFAELECFAQNERALRLYRSRGFAPIAELYGYEREPGDLPADALRAEALESIALDDAFEWLAAASRERGNLPLQVTGVSLKAREMPLHGLRHGTAQLVYCANDQAATIHSLVDLDRRQRDAQVLAATLLRHYPNHRVTVPQLQRHDAGGAALERIGFSRLPLHQLLMRKALPTG